MKKTTFLMACLVALATLLPVSAQRLTPQGQALAEKRLPNQRSQVNKQIMAEKYLPLFLQGKRIMSQNNTVFKTPLPVGAIRTKMAQSPAMGATSTYVPTIYSNFQGEKFAGFESFTPNAPTTDQLLAYSNAFFNCGSGIVDGKMCGVYFLDFGLGYAINYFAVDMDTWQVVEGPTQISDISLLAMETATDPIDGKVFGQFYTANGESMEFGVIDYRTMTRTTVGPSVQSYVALGIAQDGFAYGVATDGNLYKIDCTSGTETLVGTTGVELLNADGKVYYQSGEIDPKTNVFYWAGSDKDGQNALYTVNLSTGMATKLRDMEAGNMYQIAIPAPTAADDAPAAVENLTANFFEANLDGTVSFKMPTTTFDGVTTLTGDLEWFIYVNGIQIETGAASPGAEVTKNITVTEGLNSIEAFAKGEKGNGPKVKVKKYIGYDQPNVPTEVKFTVDNARMATVKWTAPTGGVHDGFLGPLKYNVYRISGTDTLNVATDITETSCQDQLPDGALKSYVYGVEAINNTQLSAMALSNNEIVGEAIEVPFFDDFLTDIALYTVIDVNGDASTWTWDKVDQASRYRYSTNKGDDWLITPPIKLKAGKSYNVSFKTRANGGEYYPERLEVKWGKAATVAGMTDEIIAETEIKSERYETFEKTITPTEDGKYFFGFHAVSESDKFYLYIDSISIEQAAEQTAPAAVTNLKATAAANGILNATIEFNAPSKTVGGNALTSITTIEVKRDNEIVKTLTNVTPGSAQSVLDVNAVQGNNTYTVIASNESGTGLKATTIVYVGVDIPANPVMKAKDNITSVDLTWNPATGKNGGYIDLAQVTYEIHDIAADGYVGDLIGSVVGETQYTITGLQTNQGPQDYMKWAMKAINVAGSSGWVGASVIGGAPYTLPYHNSFKGATLEDKFVGLESSSRALNANVTSEQAQDNDGGAMYFSATASGSVSAVFGKFSFTGATAPKMIFVYKTPASQAKLLVTAERPDGTRLTINEIDLSTATGEWSVASFNVPATLFSDACDIMRISLEAAEALAGRVYVDNINILEPVQKDASVELTVPENIVKGKTINMNVKVTNQGLDAIEDAKVIVSVNGEQIAEKEVTKGLKCMDEENIAVTYKTTSLDKSKTLAVKAEVVYAGDLKAENNIATASIAATQGEVAPPTNLVATSSDDGTASLTWEAPASSEILVNDDFESYEAWSLDLGDWSTIDADQGRAAGIMENQEYPHQNEKWAFMNWQPSDYLKTGQGLDPHSGTKSLVAIYQTDGSNSLNSDNWLISPRLSGKVQTVSFWVNNAMGDGYGNESFEVYTSSTNAQQASFVKVGDTHVQSNGKWTQISIEVPEGTNYFAIRHITSGDQAFIFMIDDASFTTTSAPVAYNVYRDGVLVSTVQETNYTDGTPGTEYQVTAVYPEDIESLPVTASYYSGVTSIETSGVKSYNVFTIDGRQLLNNAENINSLEPGIYIINGKKVAIFK